MITITYLKLKLFSHQFGNVHINLGHPIEGPLIEESESDEKRTLTQRLAFQCFRSVGKNLLVTPTALLSLVLLVLGTGESMSVFPESYEPPRSQ